jgi:hypothetical protein
MYSIEFENADDIKLSWSIGFVGRHNDDRDIHVKNFLKMRSNEQYLVQYDHESMNLVIGDHIYEIHELEEFFRSSLHGTIVIDATSMTVAELYIITKYLYSAGLMDVDIIYAEPDEYIKVDESYLLSDHGMGFSGNGIPALTYPQQEKKHILFLLGYEGDRFSDAIETLQAQKEDVTLIFGLPSYKINWEKNSYYENIRVIVDNQLHDRFIYAGANNSRAVEKKIDMLVKHCSNQGMQLIIVPIGTKPQAIGAIKTIAMAVAGNVSVLWDEPYRKHGRTKGVSKISLIRSLFS